MTKKKKNPILIVDSTSTLLTIEAHKLKQFRYDVLLELFQPVEQAFLFACIDPENDSQLRFKNKVEDFGYIVDIINYHHHCRKSARMAYFLGMLAVKHPDIIVVTNDFDFYYPLIDYACCRKGNVTVAYFRHKMGSQWSCSNAFEHIKFKNLNPYSKELVGVDFIEGEEINEGIGQLKF